MSSLTYLTIYLTLECSALLYAIFRLTVRKLRSILYLASKIVGAVKAAVILPVAMIRDIGSSIKDAAVNRAEVAQSGSMRPGKALIMDYEMNEKMLRMVVRKVKEALLRYEDEEEVFVYVCCF
ncbi:hypothetical protein D918_04258 [Trichuris suis]|nr:hypothetical protein D918_04258 [Trichuris suis]